MSASSTDADGAAAFAADLTVVVVSFNEPVMLTRCLASLADARRVSGVETIVVRAAAEPAGEALDGVIVVTAPPATNVPRLRALGLSRASGRIVAIIEDDCVVEPGWREALMRAHAGDDLAVGGAVEPGAYTRPLDWAAYFCDYGHFMLPFAAGPAWALPGNNMSFKRAALAGLDDDLGTEFQEAFVHRDWQARALPMRMEPAMVVRNENRWRVAHATSIPFHHGRAYAGRRLAGAPAWRRAAMSALALPMPVLKIARVAREVARRRRHMGRLAVALPWVALLSASWSAGESVGYLFGPGRSLSRWR